MSSLDEGLMVLRLGAESPSTVVYINPVFTQIFGYGLEELQGQISGTLNKLCDDQAGILKMVNAIRGQKPITEEMRCLRKDGAHFFCLVSVSFSIKPDGANDYVVFRSRDITQSRKTVRELKLSNRHLTSRNAELESLATHDQLTSLYNRRFFDSQLERLCGFHARHKLPVCLAFIDVDFYKQFNDSYGHIAGDRVLKIVASELSKTFLRLEDINARYGGDEFVVVSSCAKDRESTFAHFEILRRRVEQLAIVNENSPCGGIVTLSIGVYIGIPQETATGITILHAADMALYSAKTAGRNAAVLYSPEQHLPTAEKTQANSVIAHSGTR